MESPLLEDGVRLVVSVQPGCLELRVVQDYSSSSGASLSSAGSSRGLPSWPLVVHVVYGWRHLTQPLRLRAALSNGVGEYEVTTESLYAMNLLTPRFYVKDLVTVRVNFGEGFGVIESDALSLDGARLDAPRPPSVLGPHSPNDDHNSSSFYSQHSYDASSSHGGDAAFSSHASAGPPSHASSERVVLPPCEGGRMGEAWHHPQQQQPVGQQPQRARSHRPSGVTDDLEEGEEEGFAPDSGRRCLLTCCAPCYRGCQCVWHVGRSTPANAILTLGGVIAVACIIQYYLPLIKDNLGAAGIDLAPDLKHFLRSCLLLFLVLDGVVVVLSALLTGTTREVFCQSLVTGVFEYLPGKRLGCRCLATCLRATGGLMLLSLLLLTTLGALCLACLLLVAATCVWFSSSLAKQSCNMSTANDDSVALDALTALFDLLNDALFWVDFQNFDYDSYCHQNAKTSSPGAASLLRFEVVYDHCTTLMVACWVLVLLQALIVTIMGDNLRVARVSAETFGIRRRGFRRDLLAANDRGQE